tara:strand:+ start:359 stop:598 length:240 start_codon:yes stop_codon:yes gene_type:complete
MYGKGPFGKALDISAEVTGGVCPTCTRETMFISLTPELYRCMSCGSDCKQYVNGSIKYLPAMSKHPEIRKNGHDTKMGG